MLILGIVGSPRKYGKTSELVDAALAGAADAGAKTQKIFLVDYAVKPLTDPDGDRSAACPDALSALCEEADAIVLGAPVYYGEINGLTKDFMDSVRIDNSNGKPALGFAIAGGSTVLSHVNDSGFWLVGRLFDMDERTTLRTWTAMETTLGLTMFACAGLLWVVA